MAKQYRQFLAKVLNKEVDFNSDTLVWTLHTSTYTPNYDTHAYASDLTNELSTGGGYTAGTAGGGGLAISTPTMTYTAANSWGTARANSTAYNVGDVIRPSTGNGFLYRCIVAGTSDASPPTFLTVLGGTTAETGTVRWECIGSGIVVVNCADPVWSSFTAGPARYAVLSDRTPGTLATDPLICLVDFVTDRTGGGGNFTIDVSATLGLFWFAIP
jgi:hypothetical protein